MRVHSRFVFTPTGPTHIGHAFLWRINYQLAQRTGGSCDLRFEPALAATSLNKWADTRAICEDNLRDIERLGLPPSTVYWREHEETLRFYWQLWDLDREFGETYPPPYTPAMKGNSEAIYWAAAGNSTLNVPCLDHPAIILQRVIDDLATGRNQITRGQDLMGETDLYGYFAMRILRDRARLPRLYYIPTLRMEDSKGVAVVMSSSDPSGPILLQNVWEAGRTPEELFRWLDQRTYKSGAWDVNWTGPEPVIVDLLPSPIVLELREWKRFLKTGK